jgi:2-amino-4-hydroxy-6-hydroxymethyldihydropteridine diphosphokinase
LKDQTEASAASILIGLGSNIQPKKNIPAALDLLQEHSNVVKISSCWKSPAVGSDGPDYINAAVLIHTTLEIHDLKTNVLTVIEQKLNRVRTSDKYADRTIDLDVLVINSKVIDPELWSQPHITVPAAEVIPNLINQISKKTLSQTATEMLRKADITKISILN